MRNIMRSFVVAMTVFFLFIGCREERDRNMGTGASTPDPPATTSSSVPEPTTMLLFGSGLLGLAAYGRKRFFKR